MDRQKLTYAEQMRADGKYPVVLRFASIHPKDVAGVIGHAERRLGDLSHIDFSRTHLNQLLIGSKKFDKEIMRQYRELSKFNFKSNVVGLTKNRGKKDVARAKEQGPQDPWASQKKLRGPLREGVLTLHRDYFRADENTPGDKILEFLDDDGEIARFDIDKCNEFVAAGMKFLTEEFEHMLPYARADFDEQSIHIQFVLVDVIEEPASVRYAKGRKLFRSSHHPMIGGDGDEKKGYEVAQDKAGAFFARDEYKHMNIVRAEARAAKKREIAKQLAEMKADLDVLSFIQDDAIPPGSENARAMFLLKRDMASAISKKGDAKKVRKDDAAKLAIAYLEALGVVKPEARREASTRRARTELLAQHEDTYGSAADIIAAPDAVAEKAVKEAKERIEATEKDAEKRLAEREREMMERVRKAETSAQAMAAAAEAEKKQAKIMTEAFETGAEAVIDEKIQYREETPEKPEGLKVAKNFPKDPVDQKRLMDKIRPAFGLVVKFARRFKEKVQNIICVEKNLERKSQNLEAKMVQMGIAKPRSTPVSRAVAEARLRDFYRVPEDADRLLDEPKERERE